jgi:tRNA pseudouridine55 synthase
MDGLILVDKPEGITSHDVVSGIRKILGRKKVGHFGTLDPLATGLVLVAVGKATKLFPFFLRYAKTYEGRIRLGISTETYDAEGKFTSKESKNLPDKKELLVNMKMFEGEIEQFSPPYSAKKYKGKPLYELARQRKKYELKKSRVTVDFFKLKRYEPPHLDFMVKCSSGTYIRSLAHDLGENLGCGAHLMLLKRTSIGNFNISESHTLGEIKKMTEEGNTEKFFLPIEGLLPELPCIIVKESAVPLIANGCDIFPSSFAEQDPPFWDKAGGEEPLSAFRIYDMHGRLLALGIKNPEKNCLHPFLVFHSSARSR